MFKSATQLKECSLRAWDGEIGRVQDLYFDSLHWTLRYFVVDTGKWLNHRSVLISPESVLTPEWDNHLLPTELTQEQIRQSPGLESDQPVSRQYETAMRTHCGWQPYWGAAYGDVAAGFQIGAIPPAPIPAAPVKSSELKGDPHLFSINAVKGHHVVAADGEIGHVDDFLIDDLHWTIRYLVIDTHNWLPGKKVLLSPWWTTNLDWPGRRISLDLKRDAIRESPPYDPAKNLTAAESGVLHDYYGRPRHPSDAELIGEAIVRSDNPGSP